MFKFVCLYIVFTPFFIKYFSYTFRIIDCDQQSKTTKYEIIIGFDDAPLTNITSTIRWFQMRTNTGFVQTNNYLVLLQHEVQVDWLGGKVCL